MSGVSQVLFVNGVFQVYTLVPGLVRNRIGPGSVVTLSSSYPRWRKLRLTVIKCLAQGAKAKDMKLGSGRAGILTQVSLIP